MLFILNIKNNFADLDCKVLFENQLILSIETEGISI